MREEEKARQLNFITLLVKFETDCTMLRLATCTCLRHFVGVQWLSAESRMLESRQRDRGFEPHQCHCIVVLEQDTFILA